MNCLHLTVTPGNEHVCYQGVATCVYEVLMLQGQVVADAFKAKVCLATCMDFMSDAVGCKLAAFVQPLGPGRCLGFLWVIPWLRMHTMQCCQQVRLWSKTLTQKLLRAGCICNQGFECMP